MRRTRAVLGVAALAAAVAALALTVASNHADDRVATGILSALVIGSFAAGGLVAWARRPDNRVGPLMVGMAFAWFVSSLGLGDPDPLYSIGQALGLLPLGVYVHLLLAFPEGRLRAGADRMVTAVAYVASFAFLLAAAFFRDPRTAGDGCPECPDNLLLLSSDDAVVTALVDSVNVIGVLLAVTVIGILARRWRGATAPARRVLAPMLWSGAVTAVAGVGLFASSISGGPTQTGFRLATYAVIALVPVAFLVGLLHSRLARTAVSRLILELSGTPAPGRLREALGRALGDPSLTLAYWIPESQSYVDSAGRAMELPPPGSQRVATLVEREGRRIGALVHDVSLAEQAELVDAVCAAAGLALENERLQAELLARVEELADSELRLRALIDASPLAIVEVDREACVTFWNRAAERLYGWRSDEVLGQEVSFIARPQVDEIDAIRARMLEGEVIEGVETPRLRADGSLVDVVLSAAPVYDAKGEIVRYMAVSADDSERKRAQEELRHERDFVAALVDNAPVLVIVFDRDGRLLRFNRECERLTGYSFDEVRERDFWSLFIAPEEADRIAAALARVWEGEYPSTNENHWLTRDGERRLILWHNNGLRDDEGRVAYIVSGGLDITERKRAEEAIRASRARIVEVGDAERRRLERNLHDGVQQRLVSLSLSLRLALSKVRVDPDAAEGVLAAAGEELAQALEELRELARGIHPAILTDRGLVVALEALAGRSPTPVELDLGLEERLPPSIEAAAYYVVSESLANVAKYARASSVAVTVGRRDGVAVVEVADDGVGGADPTGGSGLRGLSDRVEALDGRLEIESVAGAGTRIRASIPLREA